MLSAPMNGSKMSIESLQGWWENPFSKNGAGMYYVKGKHVYIKNVKIAEVLKFGVGRKITLGSYNGVVRSNGREISWDSGKIVWTLIGELPDMQDPDTKQGRFKYEALLGKGANGVVCEAIDTSAKDSSRKRVAVKVLRLGPGFSNSKEMYMSAMRMHSEYLWSHMFLHNRKDARHNATQGRLFLQYFEDHTGIQQASQSTLLSPDRLQGMDRPAEVAALPYVVMELAKGDQAWSVCEFDKQDDWKNPLSVNERREVVWQLASALEYLGKFDLLHRDLHFHNIFISRSRGRLHVAIGDLGMMSRRMQAVIFVPYDEESWKMRDWVPWEAWNVPNDKSTKRRSLSPGASFRENHHAVNGNWQAFDVFSLGVIHLYLCLGQKETRRILEHTRSGLGYPSLISEKSKDLILEPDLGIKLVSKDPNNRPTPGDILTALPKIGLLWSILSAVFPACSSRAPKRTRSRSPPGTTEAGKRARQALSPKRSKPLLG